MGMKKIGGSGHVESAWVWALQSCGGKGLRKARGYGLCKVAGVCGL